MSPTQSGSWWYEFLWSPVVAAAVGALAVVCGAVTQIRSALERERAAREHEMKRQSYLRLIRPLVEQTIQLQRRYIGDQLEPAVRDSIEPLMEIHLFASPVAIAALMQSSRVYLIETLWAATSVPQPPVPNAPPPELALSSLHALTRYTESLIPLLVEARKELGLDDAPDASGVIDRQLRGHFAEVSRIVARTFYWTLYVANLVAMQGAERNHSAARQYVAPPVPEDLW